MGCGGGAAHREQEDDDEGEERQDKRGDELVVEAEAAPRDALDGHDAEGFDGEAVDGLHEVGEGRRPPARDNKAGR